MSQQDVEKMVSALSVKMEQNPGDLKGWVILARSYKALGRIGDSEKAFERGLSVIIMWIIASCFFSYFKNLPFNLL